MISINVFSEEKAWSKRLKNKDIFFKKICKAFPKKYKFLNKKVTLTLLLSNNQNIKKLNKVFRKKNKLKAEFLGRGGAWLDTGSIEDFYNTSSLFLLWKIGRVLRLLAWRK